MKLTLPEPPSANRYWRYVGGRVLLSREARAYREDVTRQVRDARCFSKQAPLALTLTWFRGRRSGDLDNRIKQVLDALRGIAYHDDVQIVELHAYRADDPHHGRVELTLERAA